MGGKATAGVELFEGNMASIQREIGRLCKDRSPSMETGLTANE